jgi:MoaD family protein
MPVVKLNANLRTIAGKREIYLKGSSLIEVITGLVHKAPPLKDAIFEDGEIREHFIITINGHHSTDLAQSINEGDIIAIFPPISGG